MSDPIEYTSGYSFAGWQAINPTRPLPAAELDDELAGVQATTQSLITALAQVRRADGNLQNDIVTWDALDADVLEGITGEGETIVVNDISDTAFASQGEAEAGVSQDKLMTPLRTAQAVNAQRPFASQSQAQAGTNNTVTMTPLRATEHLNALRALATQVDAEAGTDNAKVMTPLRVAQAMAALRTSFTGTADLTWGAIAAGASAEQSITVTGAGVGDRVVLGLAAAGVDVGLIAQAWVTAADTVRVRITNITAGAITPHAGAATTYNVTTLRF